MIRAGIGTGIRARLHGLGLHYSRGSWAAPRCREHPAGTYGGLLGPYSRAVGHGLTARMSRTTVGRAGPCCESPRRALPHGVGGCGGCRGAAAQPVPFRELWHPESSRVLAAKAARVLEQHVRRFSFPSPFRCLLKRMGSPQTQARFRSCAVAASGR